MKPKYRYANSAPLGVTLASVVTICFGGLASADSTWVGGTSTDWNTAANWNNGLPGGNALIPTTPANVATISANLTVTPVDILIGLGGGSNGKVNHTAGTAQTGGGNWFEAGSGGGTGTYNLANTAGTGGTLTGFGQGTGSLTVGGRLYVGGSEGGGRDATGSTGTVNVHTSGTLTINNDLATGTRGGTGTFNMDSGTVTTGGWNFFGKDAGIAGGNGTVRIGGGTLTQTNGGARTYIGLGNSTGSLIMSGGTYNNIGNNNDNQFVVGANNLANATTPTVVMTGGTINARRVFTIGGTEAFGGNAGNAGSGKGAVTINGAGALLNVTGEFWVGQGAGSVAAFTLNAGTVQVDNWAVCGRGGANATFTMTGGNFTKTGGGNFYFGDGGPTTASISGGTFAVTGDFAICNNATSSLTLSGGTMNMNGQFWVGQAGNTGTLTMSAGNVNVNNWFVVGRNGANGVMNMTGGTITKTGGGSFTTATGNGTHTAITNIGGTALVDVQTGVFFLCENGNDGASTLTLSGSGQLNTSELDVAYGDGPSVGTANLNGGTLRVGKIIGGAGTANVTFDGTQVIATANQLTYISNLDNAVINAGGFLLDTNGKDVNAGQALSGAGGITKTGLGTFTLTGNQTYTGLTSINAGKMINTSQATARGAFSVANVGNFGVTTAVADQSLTTSNVTLAGGSAVSFDLGNFAGVAANPALDVTGNLVMPSGTVTINITDPAPAVGHIPLLRYIPGNRSGSGVFAVGTRPHGLENAQLVDDQINGLVYLDVTSLPLLWTGNVDTTWDINTTANWYDPGTAANTVFTDGKGVRFNDDPAFGSGNTAIVLNTQVKPSDVTFENGSAIYSVSGTGRISDGPSSVTNLTKTGLAALTLNTDNDFTGVTTLTGGVTTVNNVSDGGFASPLGASTTAASNLILAGGTLNFAGTVGDSTNRGFTVTGVDNTVTSTIRASSDFTISGSVVVPTFGKLVKDGAAKLTLSNGGSNVLSAAGFRVLGGSMEIANGTYSNTGLFNISAGATLTLNSSIVTNAGDNDFGDTAGSAANLIVAGTATYTTPNRIMTGLPAGSTGNITIQNSGVVSHTGGWVSIGQNGTGSLLVKDSGQFLSPNGGDFNISDVGSSQGTMTIQDNGLVNAGTGTVFIGKGSTTSGTMNISGGTFQNNANAYFANDPNSTASVTQTGGTVNLGNAGGEVMMGQRGAATYNLSAGTVNILGWSIVGRQPVAGASGTLNISGSGVWNQLTTNRHMIIGEQADGTLTMSGNGQLNIFGDNGLLVGNSVGRDLGVLGDVHATVNLNGGTIHAKSLHEGNQGISALNFDGGTLKAMTGAAASFLHDIDTVTVKAGGGTVDTNGQNVAFNQAIANDNTGGGLTKIGSGTLYLNGAPTSIQGNTTVSAGTLGGSGTITGPVVVSSGAALNPGPAGAPGVLTAQSTTFQTGATFAIDLAATQDKLDTGVLNLNNTALVFNGTPTEAVYVFASYVALNGSFNPAGVPNGYTLDTNYNGNNEIAIVQTGTPYGDWAQARITNIDGAADATAGGDPDQDGQKNFAEFALDGNPLAGTDSGRVVSKIAAVSANGPTALVITLPVRKDTGGASAVFSGATEQVATVDGVEYHIQASDDLVTWTTLVVSEVTGGDKTAIESSMPALSDSAEWEYRTFRSPGPVAGDALEFLRVKIVNP